jgi:hypothetical protein
VSILNESLSRDSLHGTVTAHECKYKFFLHFVYFAFDFYIYRYGDCAEKADSHIASRSHDVPQPIRAAKGLECVFHIWFTKCGRV